VNRLEVTAILFRRKFVIGALIVAAVIGGVLWAQEAFWPFGPSYLRRPAAIEIAPLELNRRISVLTVPVSVALPAIGAALEAALPRSFTGRRENPMSEPFGKSDIGWTIGRGPLALAGRTEEFVLSTALSGALRITDPVSANKGSARADAQSGILNPDLENSGRDIVTGALNYRGEVRGLATLSAQPALLPNWRIDPNLKGRVRIAEEGLSIAGFTIDVTGEIKSAVDRAVNEQIDELRARLRNDPLIENVMRREWARLCSAVPIAPVAANSPSLWLEMRPLRAFASQPTIDAKAAAITIGIEAETRIVANVTQPTCQFPTLLEIIPPFEQGHFALSTPIEIPFSEISHMLNAHLSGRTFPENADAAAQVTVRRARVTPSGNRLTISLLVEAREQTTWFGFSARAAVYISVLPVLDRERQTLRLTDIVLDVQSRAAFGLFGAAVRSAIPYFEEALAESATIDLKPFVASTRSGIAAAIANYDRQDDGLSIDAAITGLRLVRFEFDAKTLRVIAEADGTAKLAVSKLPKP
jgi:Domain of unknown function (DUF4403)